MQTPIQATTTDERCVAVARRFAAPRDAVLETGMLDGMGLGGDRLDAVVGEPPPS